MTTEALVSVRPTLPALPRRGGPIRLAPPTWEAAIEAFLGWFALVRGRAPLTIETYRRALRGFVRYVQLAQHADPRLADPRDVTHRQIENYLGFLGRHGRRPALLLQHLSALRAFYRYLEREGVVSHNPAALAVGPKKVTRLPAYLTIPEQERMLAGLAATTSPTDRRDYAMVATACFTGLRCRELVQLRLDAVSFDGGFLRVVGKGNKPREVPLIPRLATILTAYLGDVRPRLIGTGESPYVFPANHHPWDAHQRRTGRMRTVRHDRRQGAALSTRGFFYVVRHQCSALVGRPVHPHMLRHSFASRLRAKGADLQLIQEILGHESIQTTTMYAHMATPHRTAMVARLLEEEA